VLLLVFELICALWLWCCQSRLSVVLLYVESALQYTDRHIHNPLQLLTKSLFIHPPTIAKEHTQTQTMIYDISLEMSNIKHKYEEKKKEKKDVCLSLYSEIKTPHM
jgi:hypothetical protein